MSRPSKVAWSFIPPSANPGYGTLRVAFAYPRMRQSIGAIRLSVGAAHERPTDKVKADMVNRRKIVLFGLASGGSAILGVPGLAQDRYPSRSLRLIVPHPVGGGVDIPARSLAEGMRAILGQPFVIENKPGAGGMLGAQMAAAAPPDGYTLSMSAPSETAIAPYLYKSMTYDPVRDLQPITLCVKAPNVLVVGPSLSVHGVAELIAAAAEKPGGLTCGTSGIGSIQHLNLALFNKLADVKITHVPYKGSSPQNADLMAGQIHMGYASVIGVLPLIKSGRLRAIAVTSRERVEALPGVPTLAETPSLAGYDLNNWAGLFAPAGLPRPVLQTLHDAAIRVVSSSEWQKPILDAGAIPSPGTPQEFAAFIAAESKKFGQIIKETNITVEG